MTSKAKIRAPLTDAILADVILKVVDAVKRETKLFARPAKIVTGVRRKLGADATKEEILRVIDALVERQALARFAGRSLYRPKKERPTPRADARVRKHRNRCLFPLSKTTTIDDVRAAVEARFDVTQRAKKTLAFRWRTKLKRTGPTLRLEELDVEELRKLVTPKRAVANATACAVLSFDDLDEVLDEANTLIEAQATIHEVTKRPYFLVWNGNRVE